MVASPELAGWLERQGVKHLRPMNIGGRQQLGLDIAMVHALHSSGAPDGTYLGPAPESSYVRRRQRHLFRWRHGPLRRHARHPRSVLAGRRVSANRRPFTMGPEDAAIAAEWLGVKTIVPMHYGTFPELTGTPADLRKHAGPRGSTSWSCRPGVAIEKRLLAFGSRLWAWSRCCWCFCAEPGCRTDA